MRHRNWREYLMTLSTGFFVEGDEVVVTPFLHRSGPGSGGNAESHEWWHGTLRDGSPYRDAEGHRARFLVDLNGHGQQGIVPLSERDAILRVRRVSGLVESAAVLPPGAEVVQAGELLVLKEFEVAEAEEPFWCPLRRASNPDISWSFGMATRFRCSEFRFTASGFRGPTFMPIGTAKIDMIWVPTKEGEKGRNA